NSGVFYPACVCQAGQHGGQSDIGALFKISSEESVHDRILTSLLCRIPDEAVGHERIRRLDDLLEGERDPLGDSRRGDLLFKTAEGIETTELSFEIFAPI